MKKYILLISIIFVQIGQSNLTYSSNSTENSEFITQSNQCNGTTQKGTQCKRLVSNGGKYCYQHTNQESKSNDKPEEKINSKPINEGVNQNGVSSSMKQCNGITKAGNQCKRMVNGSSKYCYQHLQ
jgi:RNA polymerase subunit RPABC4/transcription elongation factor Spt4